MRMLRPAIRLVLGLLVAVPPAASALLASSVATALVHRAIGDQLVAVFVDTGMCARAKPPRWCRSSGKRWALS